MIIRKCLFLVVGILCFAGCIQNTAQHSLNEYYDKDVADTISATILVAVTDEEYLQFGAGVAYVNSSGDTIIPLGKYLYLGTDSFGHFAQVIEVSKVSSNWRWMAIDQKQNVLFDLVAFDNGPEEFHEGFLRVKRNNKMGFANRYGQIVIPCKYDYAWWFKGGEAKVTYSANAVKDNQGEHTRIESSEWFYIDRNGKQLNGKNEEF